jgi:hypothetical protein
VREFGLAAIATRNYLLYITSDNSIEAGNCYINGRSFINNNNNNINNNSNNNRNHNNLYF